MYYPTRGCFVWMICKAVQTGTLGNCMGMLFRLLSGWTLSEFAAQVCECLNLNWYSFHGMTVVKSQRTTRSEPSIALKACGINIQAFQDAYV